jgi:hypothetical protein
MQTDGNVRMNWFEKDINRTITFLYFSTIIAWIVLIQISTGGYSFFHFVFSFSWLDNNLFFFVIFVVITYLLLTLLAIGIAWVSKRKNLSPFFLLLLVPVWIIFGIRISMLHPVYQTQTSIFFLTCTLIYFFVSLVIFRNLQNRDRFRADRDSERSNTTLRSLLLEMLKSPKPISRFVIVLIITITIALSIFSGFYMRFGSVNYKNIGEDYWGVVSGMSFSCPASFSETWSLSDVINTPPDEYFFMKRWDGFFQNSVSEITITKSNLTDLPKYTDLASADKLIFDISKSYYYKSEVPLQPLAFKSTTVAGVPARYVTIENSSFYLNKRGTATIYFFEYSEHLWMIEFADIGKTTTHPQPYMTRLLETFKIYDE